MNLAKSIKIRRLELGMSQEELAALVGYKTRSAIAKIESGSNEVPVSKLLSFAEALDTDIESLLRGAFDGASTRKTLGTDDSSLAKPHKTGVVILAGGKSTRNQKNIPNQFINVLGKPVIMYCLQPYQQHPLIDDIYIACLHGWEDIVQAYAEQYGITKLRGFVKASSTGVMTARNGLTQMLQDGYGEDDIVVFQESTRPFVSIESISKVLEHCQEHSTAIICQQMKENVQFLKQADGSYEYVDRNRILDLQSPDAHRIEFAKRVFYEAATREHALTESNFGMLMYNMGFEPVFCEGSSNNLKIVRQEDIATFTALLKAQ